MTKIEIQDEADVNAYFLHQARQVIKTDILPVTTDVGVPSGRAAAMGFYMAKEKTLHKRQVELQRSGVIPEKPWTLLT